MIRVPSYLQHHHSLNHLALLRKQLKKKTIFITLILMMPHQLRSYDSHNCVLDTQSINEGLTVAKQKQIIQKCLIPTSGQTHSVPGVIFLVWCVAFLRAF